VTQDLRFLILRKKKKAMDRIYRIYKIGPAAAILQNLVHPVGFALKVIGRRSLVALPTTSFNK
jgi:hypothetical protein